MKAERRRSRSWYRAEGDRFARHRRPVVQGRDLPSVDPLDLLESRGFEKLVRAVIGDINPIPMADRLKTLIAPSGFGPHACHDRRETGRDDLPLDLRQQNRSSSLAVDGWLETKRGQRSDTLLVGKPMAPGNRLSRGGCDQQPISPEKMSRGDRLLPDRGGHCRGNPVDGVVHDPQHRQTRFIRIAKRTDLEHNQSEEPGFAVDGSLPTAVN
jgi:hypothetical protein